MIDELLRVAGVASEDVVAPSPPEYLRDTWPPALKGVGAPADGAVLVRPRSTEAVAALVRWAGESGRRLTVYGAGTNVVGAIDGRADVILGLERMNRVRSLDPVSQVVTVEAGALGGLVEESLNAQGLTLGHYPQSLRISTVGGWVATRATGTASARHGGIEQLVRGLTIVLPSGEVARIASRVRSPGGLDLVALACGSEGTLGVVTEVALTVQRMLAERVVCAGFDSLGDGLSAQRELMQLGLRIGVLRLYNAAETRAIVPAELAIPSSCLLLATVVGPQGLVDAEAAAFQEICASLGGRELPSACAEPWLRRRYDAAGLIEAANMEPGRMFDTIDVSLPWLTAADCAEELEHALAPLSDPFFLHCSHAYTSGVGLYMMLHLHAGDDAAVLERWREAWGVALEIVERHGGAIGHHHGIGAVRGGAYVQTPEGRLHLELKRALDPAGVLHSGLLADGREVALPAAAVDSQHGRPG